MSEATSPNAHPGYHGPGSYKYRVLRSEDYAAKALRIEQEMFRKQNPDATNLDDYVWAVVKERDPRALPDA